MLQAYLRRTVDDLEGLANVRLCKGIYIEPPELAYREFDAVRANYVRCLERLVAQGSYVGIATHDEYLIGEALRIVRDAGVARDRYEFQMLLGVRPDRADELVARRPSAARLRAVRAALVRVLAAAAAGEPEDRRLRRRGHRRPSVQPVEHSRSAGRTACPPQPRPVSDTVSRV